MYKVDFDQIDWQSPMVGVKHKILCRNSRCLRLVEYSDTMPPHWCERGHIGYLLEGEMEIQYENSKHLYRQGDGIFIPSGSEHKHRALILTPVAKVIFVEET
jgi:ethanolamine utilization protein EutQ (cupin superfamily)